MANNVSKNPYVLDEVGAIAGLPPKIMVNNVVYSGGTTAEHRCLLEETSGGRIVADIKITAAGETSQIAVDGIYDGLFLATLDSGICYVYID